MATQSLWISTKIPDELVTIIENDLSEKYDDQLVQGMVTGRNNPEKIIRDSKVSWVPQNHWIGGFLMSYVNMANHDNFMYDLDYIDGRQMQYTTYGPGQYYGWHTDSSIGNHYHRQANGFNRSSGAEILRDFANISTETIRKLSFSLFLSEDYEGGEFQLLDDGGGLITVPKERGTLAIFDSRTRHRVRPVKSGLRKSLVGWVIGPRWK